MAHLGFVSFTPVVLDEVSVKMAISNHGSCGKSTISYLVFLGFPHYL